MRGAIQCWLRQNLPSNLSNLNDWGQKQFKPSLSVWICQQLSGIVDKHETKWAWMHLVLSTESTNQGSFCCLLKLMLCRHTHFKESQEGSAQKQLKQGELTLESRQTNSRGADSDSVSLHNCVMLTVISVKYTKVIHACTCVSRGKQWKNTKRSMFSCFHRRIEGLFPCFLFTARNKGRLIDCSHTIWKSQTNYDSCLVPVSPLRWFGNSLCFVWLQNKSYW